MIRRERAVWALLFVLLGALALQNRPAARATASSRPRPEPGARLSMDQLHRQGGVPLGWQMAPPPGDAEAGRQTFADLGCPSCHVVGGEAFSSPDAAARGPELTGMGAHHPPAYFAEAILNPDAVLIDAPGYIGADGHSTMPVYPEMTATELADLVAYLASLRSTTEPGCHTGASSDAVVLTRLPQADRPTSEGRDGATYFAQSFDVLPGRLGEFESWFASRGRAAFLAIPGLTKVETFVDASRPSDRVTTVLSFRDEAALRNFAGDPAAADLWKEFDAFVGPHGHVSTDIPLVYRVPSLSSDS